MSACLQLCSTRDQGKHDWNDVTFVHLLHGRCLTGLCHTKRAGLQAASDGAADGPLRMHALLHHMDVNLPVVEHKMSQVVAHLKVFIQSAGRTLPPPPPKVS